MKWKTSSYRLSLISCLIISPGLHAGTVGDKAGYPDGWALIAGAGEAGFMNTGSYTLTASDMTKTRDTRSFQFGFLGDLALGYGRCISEPFYLGSELGVLFFGNRKTSSSNTASNTTIVTETFNVDDPPAETASINHALSSTVTVSGNPVVPYFDLKPGVLISENSFLFGRIGIDYNQIKVNARSFYHSEGHVVKSSGRERASTGANASFSATHKKQLAGLRTGLGFEYLLTDNIGLSANYIYAFYNTFNTSATGSSNQVACDIYEGCPVKSDGTYAASGRSKMSNQQVLLELNYHLA
ncbi:MAG: hypothetical protein P1U61_04420 [Legionellaceae bacterium]|nr:hypothetical protein [Legionellaceae bacterium]